jgi:hypothetical protein
LKRQIHTERKKERKENKKYRFVVTEQARNDFTEKERKKEKEALQMLSSRNRHEATNLQRRR